MSESFRLKPVLPASITSNNSLHLCERTSLVLVPDQGRLYWLDAVATFIALELKNDKPTESVADWLVRASGLNPETAGAHVEVIQRLFQPVADPGSERFSDPMPAAPAEKMLRWRPDTPRTRPAITVRRYWLLDQAVACRFLDQTALELAADAFAHFEDFSTGPRHAVQAALSFDVGLQEGQVRLWCGPETLDEAVAPDAVIGLLRLALTEAVLAASHDDWAVHAAAVEQGGRAVLLPGAAGQGKSTLALGLGAAGCTVLGDDTLVLAARTLEIRALPFPLCAKHGAWAIAETLLGSQRTVIAGTRLDGLAVHWLPRAAGVPLAEPEAQVEAACLLFPTFEADTEARLERLDCDEAIRRLVPALHPLGTGLTPHKVDRLVAWVRSRKCFAFRYPDSETGVAGVLEVLK